ncbi:hypothetical protein [Pedobacter sp.]
MALVEDYIRSNNHLPVAQIAKHLGLNESYVIRLIRKRKIEMKPKKALHVEELEEIPVLLHFIEVRKVGWAVEVAKERIKLLEKRSMKYV